MLCSRFGPSSYLRAEETLRQGTAFSPRGSDACLECSLTQEHSFQNMNHVKIRWTVSNCGSPLLDGSERPLELPPPSLRGPQAKVNHDYSNHPWPYSVFVMRASEGVQVENKVGAGDEPPKPSSLPGPWGG